MVPKTRRGLGKGLAALIPGSETTPGLLDVDTKDIVPNPRQPRHDLDPDSLVELADSIREHGLIQPLIVTRIEPEEPVIGETTGPHYQLIAGERRFRAVKELGYEDIPAIVKDASDADSLELSLIENIQREELNPVEEASAYRELIEKFKFSQDEISKAVGKDKSTVSNTLRLLTLPKLIQEYISDSLISMGHAKAILPLVTERARIRFAKRIMKRNLSVRQTEELIKQRLQKTSKRTPEKDEHLARIEEELQHFLGTRVKVIHGKKRGRIEIFYYSNEDLDRVLDLIRKT